MKGKIKPTYFKGLPSVQVSVSTDGKLYEPITIKKVLQILQWLFRSEDIRYPQEEGFEGRRQMFRAIYQVYEGASAEQVATKFRASNQEKDSIEWKNNPQEEKWEEWVKQILNIHKKSEDGFASLVSS